MNYRTYKYCIRFTIEEYEKIQQDMEVKNYLSMSRYLRDRLFGRHSEYVPGMKKSSSLDRLAKRVGESAMSLAENGRKINALTSTINRRNELNKDGSPIKFGGMARYWAPMFGTLLKALSKQMANTKKLIDAYERNR